MILVEILHLVLVSKSMANIYQAINKHEQKKTEKNTEKKIKMY